MGSNAIKYMTIHGKHELRRTARMAIRLTSFFDISEQFALCVAIHKSTDDIILTTGAFRHHQNLKPRSLKQLIQTLRGFRFGWKVKSSPIM